MYATYSTNTNDVIQGNSMKLEKGDLERGYVTLQCRDCLYLPKSVKSFINCKAKHVSAKSNFCILSYMFTFADFPQDQSMFVCFRMAFLLQYLHQTSFYVNAFPNCFRVVLSTIGFSPCLCVTMIFVFYYLYQTSVCVFPNVFRVVASTLDFVVSKQGGLKCNTMKSSFVIGQKTKYQGHSKSSRNSLTTAAFCIMISYSQTEGYQTFLRADSAEVLRCSSKKSIRQVAFYAETPHRRQHFCRTVAGLITVEVIGSSALSSCVESASEK